MAGWRYIVLAAWAGAGVGSEPVEAQVTGASGAEVAEAFVRRLEAGEWDAAAGMVGPRMREAGVTSPMLQQTWQQLTASGALAALEREQVTEAGGYRVVDLLATFGRVTQRIRLSVDAEGRIEGFRLFPVARPEDHPPPPYARAESFEEEELEVGAAGWPLGGTLTLPRGVARAPVVVLVHGSGAHDRDETLAGNKPFRDLAHGLASRGVAVLRYEKRNWKHASRMVAEGPITVDQEVIEDALAALSKVRRHPRVDSMRVYLAGHSLGAMLAPEIAVRDGHVAGVVLLAGSPRPLTTLVQEQLAYLVTVPPNTAPEARQQIEAMQLLMAQLERRELPPEQDAMGAPASYFYDLAARDPLGFLARVQAPVLVLHGGRDYQVTERDYELYREALAGRADAGFRLYPELNHLFIAGTGKATPTEYATLRGHVDVRVIEDIAAFVGPAR